MNVTFLIGNGFDLACGLKTAYSDFVKLYIGQPSKNENIISFKKSIRKDINTWADAEIAFGKYTENYTTSTVADFREAYDDFIRELSLYLNQEQKRFDDLQIGHEIIERFTLGLLYFDRLIPEESKEHIINYYNSQEKYERTYDILSYNYTQVCEKLHDKMDEAKLKTSRLLNNKTCNNRVNSITYVHGNIVNPPLIFGVDNETQVLNRDLISIPRFARSLLKPDANNKVRGSVVKRCNDIIFGSNIICIYGMSLGTTDSIWWKRIVEWLHKNPSNQLIQYAWEPNCVKDSAGSYIDTLDDCREYLYNRLLLSDTETESLRSQIHIAVNVDLFGLSERLSPLLLQQVRKNATPIGKPLKM